MESAETKNLTALIVLEIIGRPAQHIIDTLNEIINNIDNEPRVKVKDKNVAEAKEIEGHEGFYSSFAEIEVETEGILDLVILCFKYMPAHVEVVNPELIAVTNNSWTEILCEIVRKLHQYDEITRVTHNERMIMEKKLQEIIEKIKKGELKGVEAEEKDTLKGTSEKIEEVKEKDKKEKPIKKKKKEKMDL